MGNNSYLKSVSSIMSEYSPVYPASRNWIDTIELLTSDTDSIDAKIVKELQRHLLIDGKFRQPILLCSQDQENDDGRKIVHRYVGNGTHRIVAAYLSGVESIHVTDTENLDHCFWFETSIQLPELASADDLEAVFDVLHSFPVNDEIWLDAAAMGSTGRKVRVHWILEPSEVDVPLIDEKINSILADTVPHLSWTVTTALDPDFAS